MIDQNELNVWREGDLVGYLWRDEASPQGMGFRYDSGWLDHGCYISQQLPLREETWEPQAGGAVHTFFANLLPESGARDRIVRDLKIPDTDFDLLRAIGGECAGALSILPVGQEPEVEHHYGMLEAKDLEKLVLRRGQPRRGYKEERRPRLSLAGAQDKTAVLFKEDRYYLPEGNSPSSHILKFEVPDYSNVPAYETYTTLLAACAGLDTVNVILAWSGDRSFIRIKRYDRFTDRNDRLHRTHQEDFCQALGIGYQYKYEKDGGPSFSDCFRLIQDVSTEPALDAQKLLDWQIFNVIAGNSDGHAKNLSLTYASGEVRLAPFYDLVCTRAIDRIDRHLAFHVGGESDPHLVRREHWEQEAEACGVRPSFLVKKVNALKSKLTECLPIARHEFESAYGEYPALQRIDAEVKKGLRLN